MTGSLNESHYEVVREAFESDQRSLSDFCEDESPPTTIAVTSRPGKLTEYTDEWIPALGMPEKYLKRYNQYKAGYKTNSAVDEPAHRAWIDAELEKEYMRHIRTSDDAQKAISGIVSRLRDGEDITIVCFEEPGQPCHRYLLIEMIEARLSSEYFSESREEILSA